GTTVVFPKIVEELKAELLNAAELTGARNVSAFTQAVQKEIERTLEELIEALRKQREEKDQQGQQGQQGQQQGQNPPLLPRSAELKLLKSAQLRVNDRTAAFDKARPKTETLSPEIRAQIERIARRQEAVRKMAEDMIEKAGR
ncbi:MAG: hypothetical protein N3A38_11110, partial [Planctomycetota bacterium]|nr:hypothetical protein [Planctomycetota bacterium]